MRVLVTVPWGQRLGGAEEMLNMALEGASASAHEFHLVFLEGGPWADELARTGLSVEVIAAGRLREAQRMAAAVVRLAALMRRTRPELILSWMPKTHLYTAPAAVLGGMSDRLVWWQHGISSGEWIDRLTTLLPAVAVGCSSQAAAQAQARLWPSRPTFVVNPGATAPAPAPRELELVLPDGVPIVGLVGRLQPLKAQDRLLRAHALLRDRGYRLHTLLVGGDAYGLSPDYAASLPALIEQLGLAGEVTMTGQVDDAGPYIERMDVLVNASDPPESFGIVLLEAMARGVAVLAVDAGSPGEFIEHGRTGLLARSAAPEDLADALARLLDSDELRRSLGVAGRELFEQDFTGAAMRRRFYAQLERLGPLVKLPPARP